MKKIILAFVAILYMGISTGIAMEIHYCMGKKAGVEFYGTDKDNCNKCGMKPNKGGCCKDEHKFYKLQDAHKNVSNNIDYTSTGILLFNIFPNYNWPVAANSATKAVLNNSPPDYARPHACIMHCVFRL